MGWLPPSSVPYHYSEKDSSPLTRGKLAARQRRVPQAGFIPAHAGKTRWLRARSPPKRAHSRSRGENWIRRITCGKNCGSFPLTRGKHETVCRTLERVGLIPAHAGKTWTGSDPIFSPSAHPRSRGENSLILTGRLGGAGSSPLTRGKPVRRPAAPAPRRLIPAHAGKTFLRASPRSPEAAHPRSRGENKRSDHWDPGPDGSSPLTRGKLTLSSPTISITRLIPAHAGKTGDRPSRRRARRAHPRSRGENRYQVRMTSATLGSSPLTRGKHFPTCAFTAQIDQILETLELAVSSGSYSVWVACATDAPQDQVRSIGLVLPSSRGAS